MFDSFSEGEGPLEILAEGTGPRFKPPAGVSGSVELTLRGESRMLLRGWVSQRML
jgi:hypothetical protein